MPTLRIYLVYQEPVGNGLTDLQLYIMSLGDINFILILFTIVFFSLAVNINTALHLLLTAEIL